MRAASWRAASWRAALGRALSLACPPPTPPLPPAQAHTSSSTSGTPHPRATSFGGDSATPFGCPVVPAYPCGGIGSLRVGKRAAGDCSLEEENKRLLCYIQCQTRAARVVQSKLTISQNKCRRLDERLTAAIKSREKLRSRYYRLMRRDHITTDDQEST